MGTILIIGGALIALVGGVKILVAAFKESLLWGLGSLIVPLVALIFVVTHWDEGKSGFLWSVAGLVLMFAGSALTPREEARTSALLRPRLVASRFEPSSLNSPGGGRPSWWQNDRA